MFLSLTKGEEKEEEKDLEIRTMIDVTEGSALSRGTGCFALSYFPCYCLNFHLIEIKR